MEAVVDLAVGDTSCWLFSTCLGPLSFFFESKP